MRKTMIALVAALFLAATVAQADTVNGITSRMGSDLVNWGQLQPSGCATNVSQGTGFTSTGGVGGSIAFAGGGPGQIREQDPSNCNDWAGNFAAGDNLLWTNSPGQGPLTLSFNKGLSIVGAQIQTDYFGAFTAMVCDNFGDCFSENGNSTSNGDNSAIFIGLQDLTGANLTSLTFSVTSCAFDCADFSINQLSLQSGGAPVPEPGAFVLLGSGLLGLGGWLRRRLN